VQSGCNPGEGFEKWHSRAQNRTATDHVESTHLSPPSPPHSATSSDKGDSSSFSSSSSSSHPSSTSNAYRSPIHTPPSPLSTPSPSTSPTEEFSRPLVGNAGDAQDFDLASIFSSYPGLIACEDHVYGHFDGGLRSEDEKDNKREESSFMRHPGVHCKCLTETTGYNVVLELSLRLRKAADILSHSAHHHMGSDCLLYHRITELDAFATCVSLSISCVFELTLAYIEPPWEILRPLQKIFCLIKIETVQSVRRRLCCNQLISMDMGRQLFRPFLPNRCIPSGHGNSYSQPLILLQLVMIHS
jgi:hypothetical protein